MLAYKLLTLLPMFALLIFAAAQDLRTRRIRNWLTLCLVVTGVAHSLMSARGFAPSVTFGDSILGTLAGFGLPLILCVIEVFLAAAVVGMIIVLVQCAAKGRLKVLFGNTFVLVMNVLHIGELGLRQVSETGKACRSIDRPLPYAVPVLLAVLLMVAVN